MAVAPSALRSITQQQAVRVAEEITAATRSAGGVDRVRIDASRMRFMPSSPDVLGPRYVPLERTTKFADGLIDLRTGTSAPGDGIRWNIELLSAETGQPIKDGVAAAWMSGPEGFRGRSSEYFADAFRGWTDIKDGKVGVVAHDPVPYQYPEGSGNWLDPHIHLSWKGVSGHVDGTVQLRIPSGDLDDVTHTVGVAPGVGRAYTAPWDDHALAQVDNNGFVIASEPPPL